MIERNNNSHYIHGCKIFLCIVTAFGLFKSRPNRLLRPSQASTGSEVLPISVPPSSSSRFKQPVKYRTINTKSLVSFSEIRLFLSLHQLAFPQTPNSFSSLSFQAIFLLIVLQCSCFSSYLSSILMLFSFLSIFSFHAIFLLILQFSCYFPSYLPSIFMPFSFLSIFSCHAIFLLIFL